MQSGECPVCPSVRPSIRLLSGREGAGFTGNRGGKGGPRC